MGKASAIGCHDVDHDFPGSEADEFAKIRSGQFVRVVIALSSGRQADPVGESVIQISGVEDEVGRGRVAPCKGESEVTKRIVSEAKQLLAVALDAVGHLGVDEGLYSVLDVIRAAPDSSERIAEVTDAGLGLTRSVEREGGRGHDRLHGETFVRKGRFRRSQAPLLNGPVYGGQEQLCPRSGYVQPATRGGLMLQQVCKELEQVRIAGGEVHASRFELAQAFADLGKSPPQQVGLDLLVGQILQVKGLDLPQTGAGGLQQIKRIARRGEHGKRVAAGEDGQEEVPLRRIDGALQFVDRIDDEDDPTLGHAVVPVGLVKVAWFGP